MTEDRYLTVAGSGSAQLTVSGSQFIGFVDPVTSEQAAHSVIANRREQFSDATHVVPAYRIRSDPFREYSSDDSEPSGSAGAPMLTVLKGEELENIVAVVVRYYGGTNLGIGGLVRSYQSATKRAIEAAGIIEDVPHSELLLTLQYDDSGRVRSILESTGVTYAGTYEEVVSFSVRVPTSERNELIDRLRTATSDRIEISEP